MSTTTVSVNRDVRAELRERAGELRRKFAEQGTLVVNILSSPGAGKTSLLESTARAWSGQYQMAVLVGDLATERDAERLRPLCPAEQLTTGGACHLEIPLVEKGLAALETTAVDFLFIENVGNLVCPASHDLAEHVRIVLLSVTEGDDKPAKYPKMFRTSDLLVISKSDLLPYVPFDCDNAVADARQIQPEMESLVISSQTGDGIDQWLSFLKQRRAALLAGDPSTIHGPRR